MNKTLQEMAQMNIDKIEMIVYRAAAEVAFNEVRARDFADSRKYGATYRAELLCEYDRLNVFMLQLCDGWQRATNIDRRLDAIERARVLLELVPVDPADETQCDSCQ